VTAGWSPAGAAPAPLAFAEEESSEEAKEWKAGKGIPHRF